MPAPFSVLMPLAPWEAPAVVRAALASLRAQSLPPPQVVISCDGPPPEALQEVLVTADLPVTLVIGPGAEGVGPVLTRGLEHCTFDVVLRADADDLCRPDRCSRQIATLSDHPELVAISSSVAEFEHDPSHPSHLRLLPLTPAAIQRCSRWRNPMNHPAVAFRRTAVLAVDGYRRCPGFEDYDLWLRLLKVGHRFGNEPEPLVFCRTGPCHLGRRHGWRYAQAEASFLMRCGREGLLPWTWVVMGLLCRLPLRLLPAPLLLAAMGRLLRRPAPQRSVG